MQRCDDYCLQPASTRTLLYSRTSSTDGRDERLGADVDFCVVVTLGPCVFTFYLAERVVSENRTGEYFVHDLRDMTKTWAEVCYLRAPVLDAVPDV